MLLTLRKQLKIRKMRERNKANQILKIKSMNFQSPNESWSRWRKNIKGMWKHRSDPIILSARLQSRSWRISIYFIKLLTCPTKFRSQKELNSSWSSSNKSKLGSYSKRLLMSNRLISEGSCKRREEEGQNKKLKFHMRICRILKPSEKIIWFCHPTMGLHTISLRLLRQTIKMLVQTFSRLGFQVDLEKT